MLAAAQGAESLADREISFAAFNSTNNLIQVMLFREKGNEPLLTCYTVTNKQLNSIH